MVRRFHSLVTRTVIAVLAVVFADADAGAQAVRPDSGALVTRLGEDTLAVERFVVTPTRVEADVVLRVPQTRRSRYVLELTPAGELVRMESATLDPNAPETPIARQTVTRVGDSLRIEGTARGETQARTIAAERGVLPFIDIVHWPYEIALVRARRAGQLATELPLLTGSRVSTFVLAPVGSDSVTITHPYRGTMRARIDAQGRLLGLDAGATTRKVIVERRPWMAIDPLVTQWAALDASGKSLGALSGRGEETATVAGATLTVDYGTPSKRGREIWGRLVPYGQVWRTGANQATQFSTDRDLILGTGRDTLFVPAGDYSLFSIPEQGGGWLIVNKETKQAGTAHDPAQDLGRVRLTTRPLAEPVEVFTIDVAETANANGEIKLQWDTTELVVPFRVVTVSNE